MLDQTGAMTAVASLSLDFPFLSHRDFRFQVTLSPYY